MNYRRILLGTVAGGLIMNVCDALVNVVVHDSGLQAALVQHHLTIVPWAPAILVVGPFVTSLALMLIYAGILPRFGAGFGTAVRAAAVVWVLGWLLPTFTFVILDLGPVSSHAMLVTWGAGEALLTSLVLARIYREPAAPTARAAVPA